MEQKLSSVQPTALGEREGVMVGACREPSCRADSDGVTLLAWFLGVTRFVLQNWTQGFSFLLFGFGFLFS